MGNKFEAKMKVILEKGESQQLIEDINTARAKILEIIYYFRIINLGFGVKSNQLEELLRNIIRLIKSYQESKLETKRFIESSEEILKDLIKSYNFLWENRSIIINGINDIMEESENKKYRQYCQVLRNSFENVYSKTLSFDNLESSINEADQSSDVISRVVEILPEILNECFPDLEIDEIELLVKNGMPIQNLSPEKFKRIKESEFGNSLFLRFN